ncbi:MULTISPECIES: cytochrome c oxidase subunit II [unclassified Agrococcus]|uniref:aa3-type cytochrome oxidase subunit II n=1 Tax=unclassified Agrococcus TaxID=2615065 RepID=UPI0036144ECA
MRTRRTSRWLAIPTIGVLTLALAGCTQEQMQGWLPSTPGVTNHVDRIVGLWVTSWIVLLAVGVVTWGLMLWAGIVYRRRKGQTGFPVQLRYNMPIEVFFTVVPVILVVGLFAFTARDQAAIEQPIDDPDVSITVYGKRWAWDFVYEQSDQQAVYFQGIQAQVLSGEGEAGAIDTEQLPTLYLPVNSSIEIQLESRDVAHSFWIVDFLYKKDTLPGVTNRFYFETGDVEGVFAGKCAELCGEYHSLMLFQVEVVSQAEYDAYLESLETEGNVLNDEEIAEFGEGLNPVTNPANQGRDESDTTPEAPGEQEGE